MFTDRWSIRVVPLFAILLMGLLAIALVAVADSFHRAEALTREQQFNQKLIDDGFSELLGHLDYKSQELVRALFASRKQVITDVNENKTSPLRVSLAQARKHYLVRSEQLALISMGILSADRVLLVQSNNVINLSPCREQISAISHVHEFDGYRSTSGICMVNGQLLHVTTIAMGRHIPELYIQVAADPLPHLQKLQQKLSMPIELRLVDRMLLWQSAGWPERHLVDSVIVSTRIPAVPKGNIIAVNMLKDMALYYKELEKTSYSIIVITAAVSIIVILIVLAILQRSAVMPLQRLTAHVRQTSHKQNRLGDVVTITGNAEVNELSKNINDMMSRLGSMYNSLEQLAFKDALTSLPNRSLFRDRLEQTLLSSSESNKPFALMILDLDRFKEINDTLGHHMGDLVLQQVGARLRAQLGIGDTIGRLGGDEFAILLQGAEPPNAIAASKRLQDALKKAFEVDGHNFYLGVSIGIAMFPDHGDSSSVLLQRADVAMYTAKNTKSGHRFYSPDLDQHNPEKLEMAADLRKALYDKQFDLYFQPKLNLRTDIVESVEALARWERGDKGMVSPDIFIPMLEQTGQVTELTRWVLEQSLVQARSWRDSGLPLTVAVNLSVRDLQSPDIVSLIFDMLSRHQVSTLSLDLEITENSVMSDPVRALETLGHLSSAGLNVTIDDFGTGYSSLSYLKKFPAKTIKIDKSFVIGMDKDKNDYAIVRASVGLAHHMGLKVVAEGVENKQVLESLREMGCDYAQGYYIGKPMPIEDFKGWSAQSPWPVISLSGLQV